MGVIENYLKVIKDCPDFRTNPDATEYLVSKMRQDDKDAKAELIVSTLKFIAQLAQGYCKKLNALQHLEDTLQEGNKKVASRIIHFEPERSSLKDFVHFNARAGFFDYLRKVNVINFTDYRRQMIKYIKRAHAELLKKLGREPTTEDLSDYLDMDEERVREIGILATIPILELDALSDADVGAKVIEISRHSQDKGSHNLSPLDNAINAEKLKFAVECLGKEKADFLIAYKTYGGEYFRDLYFRCKGKRQTEEGARQYIRRLVVKLEKYMQKKIRLRARGGSYGLHATYSK